MSTQIYREIKRVRREDKYKAFAGVVYNCRLYFFSSYNGQLCSYDFAKNQINIEPIEYKLDNVLGEPARCMFLDGKKIISLTGDCRYVIIFDVDTLEYDLISIGNICEGWSEYIYATYQNGKLYLFVKPGIRLFEINIYENTQKEVILLEKSEGNFVSGIERNGIVYLFQRNGNVLFMYEWKTEKVTTVKLNISGMENIIIYEDKWYILQTKGDIYYLNRSTMQAECVLSSGDYGEKYWLALFWDNEIIEIPSSAEDILRIRRDTHNIEVYSDYPEDFCYRNAEKRAKYNCFCEYQEKYYFWMRYSDYIMIIDKKTRMINWIKPQLPLIDEEMLYFKDNEASKNMNPQNLSLKEYIQKIAKGGE